MIDESADVLEIDWFILAGSNLWIRKNNVCGVCVSKKLQEICSWEVMNKILYFYCSCAQKFGSISQTLVYMVNKLTRGLKLKLFEQLDQQ